MKRFINSLFIILVCISFFSCGKDKKAKNIEEASAKKQEVQEENQIAEESEKSGSGISDSMYDLNGLSFSTEAFHTDAHKQFLNDPMVFSEVPTQGLTYENNEYYETAVVGSRVCKFYTKEAFDLDSDGDNYANLKSNCDSYATDVPIGTILKIGERIYCRDCEVSYAQSMFHFQDNWNWFYEAEWNGNSGYVFGADLQGLNKSLAENYVSAILYQTGGKFDSFYPITGYFPLSEDVRDSLENKKLAMQKVPPANYVGYDDMVDLYRSLQQKKYVPIFVTTDFAAHCQHLIFDRMLQYTEEFEFLPKLESLTDDFIEALSKRTDAPEKIREQAIQYFQVPQAIIRTGTVRTDPENYWDSVSYEDKSESEIQEILSAYPQAVQEDYKSIMDGYGDEEAIFGGGEDFSQYKPRGHYTKNGVLKTYFRAEMWYGRLHFAIAKQSKDSDIPEDIIEKELVMTLIVDTVQKNEDLYRRWSELFTPITVLIGMSDDLSFDDVCPLWKDQKVSDYSAWASDPKNVEAFMKLCTERLRPPAISGQSVFQEYSEPGEGGVPSVPMGWRLFGQRFTYDSFIHEKVSPPRLLTRDIVRGLDVMKVFGSKTADLLLQNSDYPEMPGLKETLDSLEEMFAEYDSSFWNQTYYNQILYQVKTQATFEQGAGFYFTESPAWNLKSQLAAHGTWAELRHDTILYVKQVYAERAGDGDFDPTFRTEPLPTPVHYIEPNVPFWEGSLASVNELMRIYRTYDLLDEESKSCLNRLLEIYGRALEIVKLEAENKPVSQDDINWIATIGSSMSNLVMVHNKGEYCEDNSLLKMACIADVFTNAEQGVCLEVGVGNPIRLYVPLNDSQGGKRIAVGYGFSYVEFLQPQGDRMTDDEWKKIVYTEQDGNKNYLDKYVPFWEEECFLDIGTNYYY